MRAMKGRRCRRRSTTLSAPCGLRTTSARSAAGSRSTTCDRLLERVSGLLAELNVAVERADLAREVAIIAERSDIAEELARLRSHLEQLEEVIVAGDAVGRKLEFLTQELHREANTVGSKAVERSIAARVVDLKTHIERIRELVQNIE